MAKPLNRRSRRLRRIAIALLTPPLLAIVSFRAAVAWWPYPKGLDAPPPAGTWIEDRNHVPLAAFVASNGQWQLPLTRDQISPHLLHAIVAVEDNRFERHAGVDWESVASAAWEDATHLRIHRGASTLSMQVQRLREPRPHTVWNKLEQAVRACQLEQRENKEHVLTEYLNRAPFGGNLVGAGAASWRYFGRPCQQLSLGEAALLAGLPQSPNRYRPDRFPDRAGARRAHVLDRMLACGMITATQRDEAAAEPIAATWRPAPQTCISGPLSAVRRGEEGSDDERRESRISSFHPSPQPSPLRTGERGPDADPIRVRVASGPASNPLLPTLLELARQYPGRSLVTTLDAGAQHQAEIAARDHLRELEASGVNAAAVVVLDTATGELLASVSLCRDSGGVDLTRRARSTGSVLKPLIYAAAFEAGLCTPETKLLDSPAAWPGYAPGNYDRQFRGIMTAAEALAQSRNVPALLILAKVGVPRALGVMESLGVETPSRLRRDYGLSLAIGGAEATPLEIAGAYACLGRGGVRRNVRVIAMQDRETLAVAIGAGGRADASGPLSPVLRGEGRGEGWNNQARGGHPSSDPSPQPSPLGTGERGPDEPLVERASALSAPVCFQTLEAISDPERTARVCREAAALHAAWKTGTSSGHRDAWCAAVTPRRTVVVWLGNAGGQASACLVGQEAAAPLALKLLAALDAGGPAWPSRDAARTSIAAGLVRHVDHAAQQLVLVSPAPHQEFVLSADAPADTQQVLLQAAAKNPAQAAGELWWFIDGQPIAVGRTGGQTWWPPAAGAHQVRVVDAAGHAAGTEIFVRGR